MVPNRVQALFHADPGEASVAGGHLYKVTKIDDTEVSILIPVSITVVWYDRDLF